MIRSLLPEPPLEIVTKYAGRASSAGQASTASARDQADGTIFGALTKIPKVPDKREAAKDPLEVNTERLMNLFSRNRFCDVTAINYKFRKG